MLRDMASVHGRAPRYIPVCAYVMLPDGAGGKTPGLKFRSNTIAPSSFTTLRFPSTTESSELVPDHSNDSFCGSFAVSISVQEGKSDGHFGV